MASFAANIGARLAFGAPPLAGDLPLNTVLGMLQQQQQSIAVNQSTAESRMLGQSISNVLTANRELNAKQLANINRISSAIAGPMLNIWGQAVANPMTRGMIQQNPILNALQFVPGMANPILAMSALQAQRAFPGGSMIGSGATAAAMGSRLAGMMGNFGFTGGMGAFGVGSMMVAGAQAGISPTMANLRGLNMAASRMGGPQAFGAFNAATGALQQLGPSGMASFAARLQGGAFASGMSPQFASAAAVNAASTAAQMGLPGITGALMTPGVMAAVPGALAAQGTGFGTIGAGQMGGALMGRALSALRSPSGTAMGGMLQMSRMGLDMGAAASMVDDIRAGNVGAQTMSALSNPRSLSRQLASSTGLSQSTVMGMLTTPTAGGMGAAARFGGQALLSAQNNFISSRVIQPTVQSALRSSGINLGSDRIASLLTERIMGGGLKGASHAQRLAESVIGRGRGVPSTLGAELFSSLDLATAGMGGIQAFAGMAAGAGGAGGRLGMGMGFGALNEFMRGQFGTDAGVAGRIMVDLATADQGGGIAGIRTAIGAPTKESLETLISALREIVDSGNSKRGEEVRTTIKANETGENIGWTERR
jgi:hypothetical protein